MPNLLGVAVVVLTHICTGAQVPKRTQDPRAPAQRALATWLQQGPALLPVSADGYRQENNVPQLGNAFILASEYIHLWKNDCTPRS